MSTLPAINIDLSGLPYEEALAVVKEADEAGLSATSVPEFIRDTLTYLAALSVVTSRIQLISHVSTWTRTPINMTRACRNVDILSDGRFTLGLGSMPNN